MISILTNDCYLDSKLIDLTVNLSFSIYSYRSSEFYPIVEFMIYAFEENVHKLTIIDKEADRVFSTKEEVAVFIEDNINVFETLILDQIFTRFQRLLIKERNYSIKEISELSQQFYISSLHHKCQILEMNYYEQDRNLLVLFEKCKSLKKYKLSFF